MTSEHGRYFIELQPKNGIAVPRSREAEIRREQAADFILHIGEWLRQQDMQDKVVSMAITALGQVQIICEADIIGQLQREDQNHIATVRPSAMFMETMGRWG